MKKLTNIVLAFMLFVTTLATAQYGIGTTNPSPSAVLDINSSSKGVLLPRLTNVERAAIATPAQGLLIYNTSKNCLEWYNGTSWNNPCGIVDAAPTAPSNVIATSGNAQVSVAFTPPSTSDFPITGYLVTSTPGNITATGTTSPIVVSGLVNGTEYTFSVVATSSVGSSTASVASNPVIPAAPIVPNAPTNIVATAGNAESSISFTASAPNGGPAVTSYTVTSSPGNLTASGSTSPIVITGLTNNTAYTFTVVATNSFGSSVPSQASNSVTPILSVVPDAPSSVVATAGNAQASVAFTAPAPNGGPAITGYTVTSSPGNITASGSSSPIVVTGLTNGTAYTFTVVAANAIGSSVASAASTAVTPLAPPSVPSFLAPQPSNGQVVLTWTASTGTVTQYTVQYKLVSASSWLSMTTTTATATISGLTNNSAYEFRVFASNAIGNSISTERVISTPVNGTVLLYENFDQNYTTAKWLERDNYSVVGATPTSGVISIEQSTGRLRLNPSLHGANDGNSSKSYIRTASTFDRSTNTIEIQYDVTYTACESYSANVQGYGAFGAGFPAGSPRYEVYQYGSTNYAITSYNITPGVNAPMVYTCNNSPMNVRIVLPSAGGMQIFLNGVLRHTSTATQMPNTVTNYPFYFVPNPFPQFSTYFIDNVSVLSY
jgi:hypothetical protein